MIKQKDSMFSGKLMKSGDQLIYVNNSQESQYKEFKKSLEEGQIVEIFMDANCDNGTLAQIAKIHKCIRELSKDTGDNFEDMKLRVKAKSGFCVKIELDGEKYMHCKSFGDASVEDLGLVIQTIINMGDYLNINFR